MDRSPSRGATAAGSLEAVRQRSSTETKSSLRTTELIAYAAVVLAIIMTALALDEDDRGVDPFGAESAIRYITYLTIGYMVARGLAKSGSYETRVDHDVDLDDDERAVGADDRRVDDDDVLGHDSEVLEPAVGPSPEGPRTAAGGDARP